MLDPATGDLLWAAPSNRYNFGTRGIVTDGSNLLTVEFLVDGWDTTFVARDVRTGAEVWSAPVPRAASVPGVRGIKILHRLPDGTVLYNTDSSTFGTFVALRP